MSRSAGVGLLSGGAQRTAAKIRVSAERQPVVGAHAGRLVGQPGPVQGGEQHVAGAVAGEDPAGPVAAMRRRREPEDADPGVGRRRSRAPGRPQYSSARNAARFVAATSSRHATSRGQARQMVTARSSAARSAAGRSLDAVTCAGSVAGITPSRARKNSSVRAQAEAAASAS